jgi:hypothetical protein
MCIFCVNGKWLVLGMFERQGSQNTPKNAEIWWKKDPKMTFGSPSSLGENVSHWK